MQCLYNFDLQNLKELTASPKRKSPSNVFDQDKIYHKPFANFHDLYSPSSKLKKPEIINL